MIAFDFHMGKVFFSAKLVGCMILHGLLLGLVWGQANAPSLTVEIDPEKAFLGDPVTYTVTFGSAESWQMLESTFEDTFGEATILDQTWDTVQPEENGPVYQRFQAKLGFYKLGEQEIPQQKFLAESAAGDVIELFAPALPLTIDSLLKEEDQAMAENKGQMSMKVPFFWLLLILALVVLVLLVLLGFYLRSRLNKPKPKPVIPPKPAYQEALDRLAELTRGSLLKEGRIKEFYVEIHLIVRHYFHRLYNIPAEEMTSFEFDDWLRDRRDIQQGTKDICGEFGELCDRVKFAKYDPVEGETKDLVNYAYQIVEQLKPKPQEVAVVSPS